jgi:MarR family 2-MHQ and catechol resistance regulon transcriptional repressor
MGTHYEGSKRERQALDAYIKLVRASLSLEARVNAHLQDYDLSISQFGVLEALYHRGPMHQNQLAEKILKSSGNLTLVLDNLVRRNLVTRERGKTDRRFITVHLTEEGERLIEAIFPRHVRIVVNEFGVLTPDEQVELSRLCRKVGLGKAENATAR